VEELLRSKIELSEGKEMHAKFSSGNLWGLSFFLPPLLSSSSSSSPSPLHSVFFVNLFN